LFRGMIGLCWRHRGMRPTRLARMLPAMIDSLAPLSKHEVRTVAVDRSSHVGTGAGLRLLLSVL